MDDEVVVSFSGKKRRLISSSSSDEDQPVPKHTAQNCQRSQFGTSESTRSSERIRKRQSRTFSLPSREEILKDIPTEKNVEKEIRKLTPVKLINNFTKENSRYNYDPVYTSGEESLDDFIDDESNTETSETESESKSGKRVRKRKVKYYHPRIKKESSSDTDSEQEKNRLKDNFSSETDSEIEVKLRRNSAKSKSKCIESESDNENNCKSTGVSNARKKLYGDSDNMADDKEDSEDDMVAAVERHRSCIIESDDGSGGTDTQSEVKVEMPQTPKSIVKVETDPESQVNVIDSTDLVAKVKVEPIETEVESNARDRQDSIKKDVETDIKVENISYTELERNNIDNDCVNVNNENKAGMARHDSGIVADCEFNDKSMSLSDGEEADWESSESDIEVTSERTRVSMVKKKRKKEKLFEKFREARELKLQREAKRRQSETKNETG